MDRIEYGDGNISLNAKSTIMGIDIRVSGRYVLESYDIPGFIMSYKNNCIIGISTDGGLKNGPFLKYSGDLRIMNCDIIDDKLAKTTIKLDYENNNFEHVNIEWQSISDKWEDLNKGNIFGEIPKQTSVNIITKNLHVTTDKFILNNNYYKGAFHLNNGKTMTGAEPDKNSKHLNIKRKDASNVYQKLKYIKEKY